MTVAATGTYYIATRDAVKHPTRHRTTPTTENYLTRNVTCGKAEKLWTNWTP